MATLKREPKTLLTEMVSQKVLVSLPVVFTSALLTRCRLYARFYGKGQKTKYLLANRIFMSSLLDQCF